MYNTSYHIIYGKDKNMEYKYHCQRQAESFAAAVIPAPPDYMPREGLPADYPLMFAKLRELIIKMYKDMAKRPEGYGLTLVESGVADAKLVRKSHNSIHRLADLLSCLCLNADVADNRIVVRAADFKNDVKKPHGDVSNAVPKYELILERLAGFGFEISNFSGKPFGGDVESFSLYYPAFPKMADALAGYFKSWAELKNNRGSVLVWPKEFHHHYYRFDYKVTADHASIPVSKWIEDESVYRGYDKKTVKFYNAFYEYSKKFPGVRFDGDYNLKSRRIARDVHDGPGKGHLCILMKRMDEYMGELEKMPDSVKKPFTEDHCGHCDFQGATDEFCKFRRKWTMDGVSHEACAHYGFNFTDFDLKRVPDYWRLLELEYGLEKA